ncbi:hypothetical protein MHI57_24395 [Cytobacillus sp. FSL K6-0129]|uniref:hypothetical protein n=1 Tax=unclassified Cytobacillus TaxID=2675268 RepID=UPI0030FBA7AC
MKKLFSVFMFFSILFIGNAVLAEEPEVIPDVEPEILTTEEFNYLLQIGHTSEEINELPIEVAKQLVQDEATIEDKGAVDADFDVAGTIPSKTMTLYATAYKVTSDRTNDDKFFIYGNFKWLKTPSNNLVDKMTFGFPSSAGFYLPTSSGKVTQHQHRYSQDQQGNGRWIDYALKTAPSDWAASSGVAGSFDLRASTSNTKHKGFMSQYVYVPKSKNGTMNIKVEYGHKRVSGTPTVGVYPPGLGITPGSTVDTVSYALTVKY